MSLNWKIGLAIVAFAIVCGITLRTLELNNAPKISYVSSTEYIASDEGQTIIRVTNAQGLPLLSETCYDTVLYPNKTIFLQSQLMTLNAIDNYYDTFTVPEQAGVYESLVLCTFGGKNVTNSKTFHVSLLSSQIETRFSELNAQIQSLSMGIWNYSNRTLTGTQLVSIDYDLASAYVWNYTTRDLTNYTKVGDAVWYWEGIMSPGILGNMTDGVWNYPARYIHGEII